MTTQEAILILDPATTRKALEPYVYDPKRRIHVVEQACLVACAALRAQQEEKDEPKTPCDLCMYNPPSSLDGKPCCICPAARKYQPKEE